jgi:hypothetical protein
MSSNSEDQDLNATKEDQELSGILHEPFPAPNKIYSVLINDTHHEASSIYFSDKIMVTISQGGQLSQWVGRGTLIFLTFFSSKHRYKSYYLKPRQHR